jgi:calcineurin-like phosphoesterase family protein
MIWFTADLHLGHPGILLHQSARLNAFRCLEEMDAHLITQINKWVHPNDILYHLGDFCWEASRAGHYRARLNVRELHFIRGNHDASSLRVHGSSLRDTLYRRFQYDDERFRVHMCHYPMLSWRGLHNGSIHLYGHVHGIFEDELNSLWPGRRAMDVGVDNIYQVKGFWKPISLNEIINDLAVGEAYGHDIMKGRSEQ